MVFFSCDSCGDSLKKAQVANHLFRCRSDCFSCLDCNQFFTKTSYVAHVKCISEEQKYGGKNFVVKENKGEAKQNAWVDQVEQAIDNVSDPGLKSLLEKIQGFANIPRKEAKFINFLQNSMRIRDRGLCTRAWNAIAEGAKKIKDAEDKAKAIEAAQKKAEETTKSEPETAEKPTADEKSVPEDETQTNGEETKHSSASFKWKKAIKRKLKGSGGEMKIKKLKKALLEDYTSVLGTTVAEEEFDGLFTAKLEKAGVVVDGKTVSLAA